MASLESMRIFQQRALQQLLQTRPAFRWQTIRQSQPLRRAVSTHSTSPLSQQCKHARSSRFTFSKNFGPFRRYQSTTQPQNLSLAERMKKLSREYGWSFLGVYLALSALDFPFCFLAVRLIGTETIGHWEHVVVSYVKSWVKWPLGEEQQEMVDNVTGDAKKMIRRQVPSETLREDGETRLLEEDETYISTDHGVAEAEKANRGSGASLGTQLALAYAIHKSFIFIRVPLTAAVLPKVVKTLRSWGYNIGKRRPKIAASGAAGVNTGKTGVRP